MRLAKLIGMLGLVSSACAHAAPPRTTARQDATPWPEPPSAPAVATTTATPPRNGDEVRDATLRQARASYQAFLDRADGKPEYAGAALRARERIDDIDRILIFMEGETRKTPRP